MKIDRIYTPWRMKYIVSDKDDCPCIFCAKAEENNDDENYILYRGEYFFIILNLYPYNNGHLMLVPYRHTCTLADLESGELLEMGRLIQKCEDVFRKEYNPQGFNIGMNLGRDAGAGIDRHIHLHIVPRWRGDTNFMTVTGETKVLPETIEQTYKRLKKHFLEEEK